jgi:hypothetical protein
VSPSWRDRLEIFVGPETVDVTRHARGLRQPKPQRQSFAVGTGGVRWKAALEALRQALAAAPAPGGQASVTVSNHFVCFALVPDAARLRDDGEREAAARHTLRATFGDVAERWRVVLDTGSGRAPAVAAGIETEFLDGIVTELAAARVRPLRVQPLFAAALNECHKAVGNGRAWFGVAEPGRLALAYVEHGACRSLRMHRLRHALAQELPVLLDQDRLTGAIDDNDGSGGSPVVLATRETLRLDPNQTGAWTVRAVQLRSAAAAGD